MREHGFLEDPKLGTVRDLVQQKPRGGVITAVSTDRVKDVIAKLKEHGVSQLPVVKDGRVLGVVTEVSLLRYLASGEYSLSSPIESLAESDYATVTPGTSVELLQGLLGDARLAIVMDDDKMTGVITKIDLIEYLAGGRPRGSVLPPRST
jgi:cystathionine beta-synthase